MANPPPISLAVAHHQAGRLAEAETLYRDILARQPDDLNALNLLGVLTRQTARPQEATELLQRAAANPQAAADVHYNLGTALNDLQRWSDAAAAFRRALATQPQRADFWNMLGVSFNRLGRIADALACYRAAASVDPANAACYSNLGACLMQSAQGTAALPMLRRAVTLAPDHVQALNNFGAALNSVLLWREASRCFQQALILAPAFAEGWNNLGSALRQRDRARAAVTATERAVRINPDFGDARLNLCVAELPVLYDSEADIAERRAAYEARLGELEAWVEKARPAVRHATADAIGSSQPFALPYQGRNDVALQRRYGEILARLMAERHPAWSRALPMHATGPDGRIRVGFASAQLRDHSVWKAITRGFLDGLDRREFATFCYALGNARDAETTWAERRADRFVAGGRPMAAWAELIRRDNLHVLIFPEVGMDPTTVQLAALRLAPLQCVAWGHPETTGLPTIDHYLSGDRLEPATGAKHYSEELVQLPRLGSCYEPGSVAPPGTRAEFGLPDGPVLFLAPHTLFKYLPQHDALLAQLARRAGDCRFVFFAHPAGPEITERFVIRMRRAFADAGLDWQNYGIVLPRLEFPRFQRLMGCVDIALDSLSFSGFNTAMEALVCNLPVVTCRGPLMRSRFAAGILDHIGVVETVAAGPDGFIEIAARLATDPAWRARIKELLRARLPLAFRDPQPVEALAAFLKKRVGMLMEPEQRHASVVARMQANAAPEAIAMAERLLAHDPTDATLLHIAGLAARAQGDLKQAVMWLGRSVALAPRNADFQNSLGVVLRALGQREEAIAAYKRGLAVTPTHAGILGNYANLLIDKERPKGADKEREKAREQDREIALGLLRSLAKAHPRDVSSWTRLGEALHGAHQLAGAVKAYRNALVLDPGHPDAAANLGISHRGLDQLEKGALWYRRALHVDPRNVAVWINYASCLRGIEKMDEALAAIDTAIAIDPNNGSAHFARSMILLLMGRLAEGWKEYEWRWRTTILVSRPFPQPRWDGRPFPGKSLLVHTEQGMGDLLNFVRFMPAVKALGGTVVLEIQPELARMMDRYPGVDMMFERGGPPPPTDLQLPLLDLPSVLGVTLENVAQDSSYLTAPSGKVEPWRQRLQASALKVGLVWAGNPDHANDRRRSIPAALVQPLLNVRGANFYSLQVGAKSGDAQLFGRKIIDLSPELTDWTETAGALMNLDLLITVDTSVAHMAGALGRPVWVLLPIECDFRWMLHREDTPWYPSMRLFRQVNRGDWAEVIARVAQALTQLAAPHAKR